MLKKFNLKSVALMAVVSLALTSFASAASLKDGSFETKTNDASVKIGNPLYTSNGEFVDGDVYSGQTIDMTLPVVLEESRNITAITLLTDENNTVCDITYDERKSAVGNIDLSNTLTVSKAHENGKYTLKTFIWDGINLSRIYADSFAYSNGKTSLSTDNWSIFGDAEFSSEMALEGLSSLKIKSDAKISQTAKLLANEVYKLDFAAVGAANFSYDIVNVKDGSSLIGGAKYFEGSEEWSFPSNVVFATDEKTQVNIIFEDAGFDEASYIDCVKITEELLSNNSFDYELANFVTDGTAEKHDAFVEHDGNGGMIEEFSGKLLAQQEPDASSFPNGGLRNTFEARGYSAWDPSSPAFIVDDTLCIPTVFIAYTGEALDYKTPLIRSIEALNKAAKEVCLYFNEDIQKITTYLGWEQEYFLVDEDLYAARPDLSLTERTLVGHESAKNQQLDDHYFGAIPSRVQEFMKDLETECYKLGIPFKTRHNEVAPNQFELAPIYEECNLANDNNQLLMSVMKRISSRHKFRVLLHEKPFMGVNGSGKHCNWSMGTDTGINLFSPGKDRKDNLRFITFVVNS